MAAFVFASPLHAQEVAAAGRYPAGVVAQWSIIAAGFALTAFFLTRRVLEPRGLELPEARAALIAAFAREAA